MKNLKKLVKIESEVRPLTIILFLLCVVYVQFNPTCMAQQNTYVQSYSLLYTLCICMYVMQSKVVLGLQPPPKHSVLDRSNLGQEASSSMPPPLPVQYRVPHYAFPQSHVHIWYVSECMCE